MFFFFFPEKSGLEKKLSHWDRRVMVGENNFLLQGRGFSGSPPRRRNVARSDESRARDGLASPVTCSYLWDRVPASLRCYLSPFAFRGSRCRALFLYLTFFFPLVLLSFLCLFLSPFFIFAFFCDAPLKFHALFHGALFRPGFNKRGLTLLPGVVFGFDEDYDFYGGRWMLTNVC